jgi:hypothetical protein
MVLLAAERAESHLAGGIPFQNELRQLRLFFVCSKDSKGTSVFVASVQRRACRCGVLWRGTRCWPLLENELRQLRLFFVCNKDSKGTGVVVVSVQRYSCLCGILRRCITYGPDPLQKAMENPYAEEIFARLEWLFTACRRAGRRTRPV